MNVILCCIILGWIYLVFSFNLLKWLETNILEGGLSDLPIGIYLLARAHSLLSRTFPYIKPRSWRWGYEQFHALLPSTFLDFCWFLVDELVFIIDATQGLPWLPNSVAESCSSLFVSDMPAVLKIKEWTSLVFVWKLHLQWPRDVFCVVMVVLRLTRHNR